jgi:hypothetical protein
MLFHPVSVLAQPQWSSWGQPSGGGGQFGQQGSQGAGPGAYTPPNLGGNYQAGGYQGPGAGGQQQGSTSGWQSRQESWGASPGQSQGNLRRVDPPPPSPPVKVAPTYRPLHTCIRALVPNGDASECDFSGRILVGKRLTNVNFRESVFIDADLTGADLTGANLQEANLYRARLNQAKFVRADMERTNLSGTTAFDADFTEAILSGMQCAAPAPRGSHPLPAPPPTRWLTFCRSAPLPPPLRAGGSPPSSVAATSPTQTSPAPRWTLWTWPATPLLIHATPRPHPHPRPRRAPPPPSPDRHTRHARESPATRARSRAARSSWRASPR